MRIGFLTTDARESFPQFDPRVPNFGSAPRALLQGFTEIPDLEIHVLSCAQQPMRSVEKLADNIWFHSLHVPKIGWLRTGYQGCIRALRKKLREIRPDIVHGQGTERDCAISAVFSGHPNVVTIHGNMGELARLFHARFGSYGWLTARLENLALTRTGGVFCNSAYTENLVRSRARKTWRVPNALRQEFFLRLNHIPGASCQVLNIGVISPRKRQLELLGAIERLRAAGLNFHFRFIGEARESDSYARAFLERIRPLQAAGIASHSTSRQTAKLVEELDRSHALVHFPSEEAFGLVAAEALARGCKFFGARTGGIVDIIAGVAGAELYNVDDWTGLISGITAWMQSGCARLPDAARLMRTRYSPEVVARRHLEIYREVLEGHPDVSAK